MAVEGMAVSYETDREQIVLAASRVASGREAGLCGAFIEEGLNLRTYLLVMPYLNYLGASREDGYKWPLNSEGREQRLTFLAFMLTWLDDYHGRNWQE